jgi:hypothetical protein
MGLWEVMSGGDLVEYRLCTSVEDLLAVVVDESTLMKLDIGWQAGELKKLR